VDLEAAGQGGTLWVRIKLPVGAEVFGFMGSLQWPRRVVKRCLYQLVAISCCNIAEGKRIAMVMIKSKKRCGLWVWVC
jgi:hypothetical protein